MSQSPFVGLGLGNIMMLSNAKSRSISAENFTGEKGKGGMATEGVSTQAARELGQGWKVSPAVFVEGGATFTMAEIEGPGMIQHIWFTINETTWRGWVLRVYYDGEESPSVEVPAGDFFCNGWNKHSQVNSIPIAVNTIGGFNSYWPMPFRKSIKITMQNILERREALYFQVSYALQDIPEDAAYLHAQFRRSNPLDDKTDHVLVDGIQGKGHYVGCYMAWQTNNSGWWGEGEIKFYMDGDKEWPTICGTGTEDYFGGAYCFSLKDKQDKMQYGLYSTPFLGFHQCLPEEGTGKPGQRFGLYRWHVMDPIRFESDLKVTMQALGWRCDPANKGNYRYLPLRDDIASMTVWYQQEPHAPFPPFPTANGLEVI